MDPLKEEEFRLARVKETEDKIRLEILRISKIPHNALSKDDKAFLRAREFYLTEGERKEYAVELAEKPETEDGDSSYTNWTRKELEERAIGLNISNPSDKKIYPRNAELISAIEKAESEQA